jgi:Uma2 family endonuclease
MSFTLLPAPEQEEQKRKQFTREDCDFLERVGLLTERYELLNGDIVIMGQNRPHTIVITQLFAWLILVFGTRFVQSQGDIEVAENDTLTNRPQPDFAVTLLPNIDYKSPPRGIDLRLAVEISDTTLQTDIRVKADLYARAGVPEYWVLDIKGRRFIVHRDIGDGKYTTVFAVSEDSLIAPESSPENFVCAADLLPPKDMK